MRLNFDGLKQRGTSQFDKVRKIKKQKAEEEDSDQDSYDDEVGEEELDEDALEKDNLIAQKTSGDQFLIKREATLLSIL